MSKLCLKTTRNYFIGYRINAKGYRFYYPIRRTKIVETITAKFLKNNLQSSDKSINEGTSSTRDLFIVPIPIVQEIVVLQPIERIAKELQHEVEVVEELLQLAPEQHIKISHFKRSQRE